MKFPGKPEEPPGWYRDRGPSYIEDRFCRELGDLASLIENEIWFGDVEKHSRYRVDFILKDARIIIELDGYEYHSSPEQLERDSIRQRYLTRAGYSVIRFTGREIKRDAAGCVEEVRQIYKERLQRKQSRHRALYIDYRFLISQMLEAHRFYERIYPEKCFSLPSLGSFISHAVDWLHERSFIAAFVFLPPDDLSNISSLDGTITESEKAEIRISLNPSEMYSLELGDHLMSFSHLFDEFYFIADDVVYLDLLSDLFPAREGEDSLRIGSAGLPWWKILRKENDETAFANTFLASIPWQNVWYPIGAAMGLEVHEL